MSALPPGSSSPDAGKPETDINQTASATAIGHPFPDDESPPADNPQQAVGVNGNASGRPHRRRRKPKIDAALPEVGPAAAVNPVPGGSGSSVAAVATEEAPKSEPDRSLNQRSRANKKTASAAVSSVEEKPVHWRKQSYRGGARPVVEEPPVVVVKELQPLTPAEAMMAAVVADAEPIRSVRIKSIPARMTLTKLKTILLDMFGGTIVGVEIVGKSKRKIFGKFAIVTYAEAETATQVLSNRTARWQNGRLLLAIPSVTAADNYSSVSRLRLALNDDCLLHIYRYLSLWDVFNCNATSPQLAEFAEANVFSIRARNCSLFRHCHHNADCAVLGDKVPQISRPRIAQALRCLGNFLTSLTINGALVARGHECLRHVLQHCSQLHTLRLHYLNLSPFRGEPPLPNGTEFGAIREIALILCEHVQQPLLTFIAQLPQLERLSLLDSLNSKPPRDPDNQLLASSNSSLRMPCKQLRYLSVRNLRVHLPLLCDAIGGSAQTLRELSVLMPYQAVYQAIWFEAMQPFLGKQMESLLVMQPVDDNRNGELRLDELVGALGGGALRKLVMWDWYAGPVLLDWLARMGGGKLPQLQALSLNLNSQMLTPRVCKELVRSFGEQLCVLEVRDASDNMMTELQVMCGKMQELRELHLVECYSDAVLAVVLEAIAANPHLWRVELRFSNIGNMAPFVESLVDGLRRRRRRAAAAAALAGGDATNWPAPVLQLRVTGSMMDVMQAPTVEQLRASEDVLSWQFVAAYRESEWDGVWPGHVGLVLDELNSESVYNSDGWLNYWSDEEGCEDGYVDRDIYPNNNYSFGGACDVNELGDVNDIGLFVGGTLN